MELFRRIMYLPLYSDGERKIFFRIPFRKFAITTVLLPLTGFTLCVILSILKDFESATFTHCNVLNILPSVSAAIGSFYPQNIVWQFSIALHSPSRLYIAYLYYHYYKNLTKRTVHFFVFLVSLLHIIELSSLIGLSFWSSSTNYPVHKACFITFVATSEIYMLSSCILLRRHKRNQSTDIESFSLKIKWYLFMINVLSFMSAGYFFMRHNSFCEPMMYTFFAASEYMVILTNMGFHMTSCYDFIGREILFRNFGVSLN